MTTKTRNDDLLDRMRRANPVSAAEIEATLTDERIDREMARAIAAGELPSQPVPAGDRVAQEFPRRSLAAPPRRRGATLGFGAGLAGVAVLAALLVLGGGSLGGGSQPAFAAAAVEVAEANPRLLLSAPGWQVTRADEFEADSGEMTFSDGAHQLDLTWYPARFYGSYLRDRAAVRPPVESTLLGGAATTVDYGGEELATMLAPEGAVFVEVRGKLSGEAEYEQVLHSLHPVDVETWLQAMPASVVSPDARAAAVKAMLRGVPLPPGFDLAALEGESTVLDGYQLGAKVSGAVACSWTESWLAATAAGDVAAAKAAVDAMASSREWPILRQMASEGGWSQAVWMTADDLREGRLNRGVAMVETKEDGTRVASGPAWATGLGCSSAEYRKSLGG